MRTRSAYESQSAGPGPHQVDPGGLRVELPGLVGQGEGGGDGEGLELELEGGADEEDKDGRI